MLYNVPTWAVMALTILRKALIATSTSKESCISWPAARAPHSTSSQYDHTPHATKPVFQRSYTMGGSEVQSAFVQPQGNRIQSNTNSWLWESYYYHFIRYNDFNCFSFTKDNHQWVSHKDGGYIMDSQTTSDLLESCHNSGCEVHVTIRVSMHCTKNSHCSGMGISWAMEILADPDFAMIKNMMPQLYKMLPHILEKYRCHWWHHTNICQTVCKG